MKTQPALCFFNTIESKTRLLPYQQQQIEIIYKRRDGPRRSAYGGDFDDDELDEYDFEAAFKAAKQNRRLQLEEPQDSYEIFQPEDDKKVEDNWVQKSSIAFFISLAFIYICAIGSQNFFQSFSVMPPDPNFEPDEEQVVVESKKQPSKVSKLPDARTINFDALLKDT